MLPTFVGVGVPRGGTTWLHELLSSHPDVLMPTRRKEIHFFDRHFEKGQDWYESFFVTEDAHTVIGEITPHYLFFPEVPERIASMPRIERLIVILRNPVERSFSHYTWRMRMENFQGDFLHFMDTFEKGTRWSLYADGLERFISVFGRDRMLILIHERIFDDPVETRKAIADWIGVDPSRFPEDAGQARVNTAVIPRFGRSAALASKVSWHLRQHDLDWIPNLIGRKLRIKRLFGRTRAPKPILSAEDRIEIGKRFHSDIQRTRKILNDPLEEWND